MTETTEHHADDNPADDPDLQDLLKGAFARLAEAIRQSILAEIQPRLSGLEEKVQQIDEAIWAPEDEGAAED